MSTRDPRRDGAATELPRDGVLSRLYRAQAEAGNLTPPAALDAQILVAARRAAGAPPGRTARARLPWWRRLSVPVAVAAVLLLSATLTLMVHDEQRMREAPPPLAAPAGAPESPAAGGRVPVPVQKPAPADSAAPPRDLPVRSAPSTQVPTRPAPETRVTPARERTGDSAAKLNRQIPAPSNESDAAAHMPRREAVSRPAPAAFPAESDALSSAKSQAPSAVAAPAAAAKEAAGVPAPPADAAAGSAPPPASPASSAPAASPGSPERRARVVREAGPQSAPAPEHAMPAQDAPKPEPKPKLRAQPEPGAQRSPAAWLAEIRELRRAGREAEWREALERFRARYPDYPVPDELQ